MKKKVMSVVFVTLIFLVAHGVSSNEKHHNDTNNLPTIGSEKKSTRRTTGKIRSFARRKVAISF